MSFGTYLARGVQIDDTSCVSKLESTFPQLKDTLNTLVPPNGVYLKYGTAGFRASAELLDSTFLRMGVLAALRSRFHQGAAVGLMVTASHNAEKDNGIKLVDADGGMLAVSWEKFAQDLANAPQEQLLSTLAGVITAQRGREFGMLARGGTVCIARDTRSHSSKLASLALQGARAIGATVVDLGLLTTPQLHHIVRMRNIARRVELSDDTGVDPATALRWSGESGYYTMLAEGFQGLTGDAESTDPRLVVDAAGGVGAPKMELCVEALSGSPVQLTIVNHVGECVLNEQCGAEYVQKGRVPPGGVKDHTGVRICSFDGDADRLIYHWFAPQTSSWILLDGDKIATLAADFIIEELREAGLQREFRTAVVQTAYANGASTNYLRGCEGLHLDFAKTGVKFVHHVATHYDIGVYFEANGHGTVLFKGHVIRRLRAKQAKHASPRKALALRRLLATVTLVNQAVGDAMSDCLFIEAVLRVRGWTLNDWDALYADLPSRQCKLAVKDRAVVKCSDDETRALLPDGLQAALDSATEGISNGRCFVRPSGTEDVVRIYAEAATQADADALAVKAAAAVYDIVGGTGDRITGF